MWRKKIPDKYFGKINFTKTVTGVSKGFYLRMHYVLFFGGMSVLIGSCLIVCICNHMKKRHLQKKQVQKMVLTPTISLTMACDPVDFSPTGYFKPTPSPSNSFCSPKSPVSAINSTGSTNCLIPPNSPTLLRVPDLKQLDPPLGYREDSFSAKSY